MKQLKMSAFTGLVMALLMVAMVKSQNPRQTIKVYEGQGVRLVCNASTSGSPTEYQWEKPMGKVIAREYILFLPRVSYADTGVYICRASTTVNGQRVESTEATQLDIKDTDSVLDIGGGGLDDVNRPVQVVFQPPVPGNVKVLDAGASLYQTCRVEPQDNNYVYQWIGPNNRQLTNSNFFYLQPVGANHVGTYTCVATHTVTKREERLQFRLELAGGSGSRPDVDGAGFVSSFTVSVETDPSPPQYNRSLTLTCRTNPPVFGARYEWFINNVPSGNDQTLVLPYTTKRQMNSNYECRVTYAGSTRNAKVATSLAAYAGAELSLRLRPGPQFNVRIGDKRELHCEVDRDLVSQGVRGRNMQWFFNGQPLTNDVLPGYRIDRVDRIYVSIITLNSVEVRNEGHYECRYQNVLKEAFLVVLEESISLQVAPKLIDVNESMPVEFHCRISNLPNVINSDLKWYFLGESQDGPRQELRVEWLKTYPASARETAFISMETCEMRDKGFYLCVAPNGLTAVGELRITQVKKGRSIVNVRVTPREVRIRPGRSLSFDCLAIVDGAPGGEPKWRFLTTQRPVETDSRYRVSVSGIGRSTLYVSGLESYENGTQVECYYEIAKDHGIIYIEDPCSDARSFRCRNNRCIDTSLRCNGINDCYDNSDEDPQYCTQCDPLEVKCQVHNGVQPTKLTYSASWQCDGENDCGNNYDESECYLSGQQCGGTMFDCGNGVTIPRAFVCDKEADCFNNRDEQDCASAPMITSLGMRERYIKTVRRGDTVTFSCTAKGNPRPKVIWRYNWRCLPDKYRMTYKEYNSDCNTVESTITITNVQPGDDGIYNCEALSSNLRTISDDYQLILQIF